MSAKAGQGVVGFGYEGADLEGFLGTLLARGVRTVVDVRLTPISRKPGFSKRRLAAALAELGIDYVHLPALGNPKWNRPGFSGSAAALAAARAAYAERIACREARDGIEQIVSRAGSRLVAVLCFEADQQRCHRDIVLDQVRDRLQHRAGELI